MSFEDHHYVVLLAVSASCASLHLASDVFNIMQDQTSLNGDLQTLCVASLRLVAFVASIILLEQTHNGPWIDFCILASILLLLVGEVRGPRALKRDAAKAISIVVDPSEGYAKDLYFEAHFRGGEHCCNRCKIL